LAPIGSLAPPLGDVVLGGANTMSEEQDDGGSVVVVI
jgi:hypothetical protein